MAFSGKVFLQNSICPGFASKYWMKLVTHGYSIPTVFKIR